MKQCNNSGTLTATKRRKKTRKQITLPPKAIQFNWRRNWSKKVAPYLNEELVQICLDMGMTMLDPTWQRGDAPFVLGAIGANRIIKGKLSWYQPLNRCHHIAFFSMAIGVLNYPDLEWRFVSGDRHTVPVGYDADGNPAVVMDILLSDHQNAEESMALAQETFPALRASEEDREAWEKLHATFVAKMVPALKARARERQKTRLVTNGKKA
jgi:hypothetical protein